MMPGPLEIPFPKILVVRQKPSFLCNCVKLAPPTRGDICFLLAEGTNGHLWDLLAYQSSCWHQGSFSTTSTWYTFQSVILASQLFLPLPPTLTHRIPPPTALYSYNPVILTMSLLFHHFLWSQSLCLSLPLLLLSLAVPLCWPRLF